VANINSQDEPGGTGDGPPVADERDQASDERDQASDERDQAADERDQAGDERDQASDQRDQASDQRDQASDQRDQASDQRDQAADQRDQAAISAGIPTTDALNRSAMARREAASDRMRASQDRQAGASERATAELDRNTALADRGVSAREREEQARLDVAARSEKSRRLESLGELAVGVAHDFNNLLGVILNYTALVAKRVTDTTAAADLGEIRAAAERAAGLTRQLLTFARRDVANPEPLDVNEIVRAMASMLDRTLGEDIELRVDLGDGPLVAIADQHQLEQIVLNLAINARDAMPAGGKLSLVTEPLAPARGMAYRGPDVVLRVVDTGHGMTQEVVTQAFEPFFTTKPQSQGTGLGLATVYSNVRQHGGEVTIDSAVDVGTTVTVVLRGADTTPAIAGGETPIETPAGGHERILLVEDEAMLRMGTARILAEQGYEVLAAGDGVEALEVFERERGALDVVVTDVAMPRMRGDELAQRLGERSPGIPVIFLSGYDTNQAALTGRLLTKPVADDILLRVIREVLDDRS
jgi:two-component system cell cycle sensor histidine kinase/response regulator CckA